MPKRFRRGSFQGWSSHFKGWGYRITVPRKIILQVLNEAEKHLSAEDIYFRAYQIYPAVGLTTVYRTLDLLTKNGLVIKIESGDGRARYELTNRYEGINCHQHLVCTHCNAFFDYHDFSQEEIEIMRKMKQKLLEKYGFKVKSCILQFHGECQNCQERQPLDRGLENNDKKER